jgi:membrane-associated phospholipid phosphatase
MSDDDRGEKRAGSSLWLADDTRAEEHIGGRDLAHWPTAAGRALVHLVTRVSAGVSAHAVLYLTLLLGLGIVVGITAAGAAVYDAVAENDGISRIDQPALDLAITLRTPTSTDVITAFTQLGGPIGMPIITALITAVMVWRWRSGTPLVLMVIATAGSLLMTNVGKAVVGRPRPPLPEAVPPYEYAFSFPSGHTLNSTVIAGVVAYLLIRRLQTTWTRVLTVVVAVAWALTMGLSRVFLGHHWLTDVMFGWLAGAAWVALIITAHRLFLTIRRHRQSPS